MYTYAHACMHKRKKVTTELTSDTRLFSSLIKFNENKIMSRVVISQTLHGK